jgi:hypothetical protein
MPNNLTTIIQSNLAKVNNNTQLTESQKKNFQRIRLSINVQDFGKHCRGNNARVSRY